jgi:hypothetical protein
MLPLLIFYSVCIFVLVVWSFSAGMKVLDHAKRQPLAERRQTLSWAAGNLVEPLINMFLVSMLLHILVPRYIHRLTTDLPVWELIPQVTLATLPLLVLLKPLLGWNSSDELSRDLNRTLFWLGLLRWGSTILGLIFMPAVLVGIIMLFVSLLIIQDLADNIVNPKPVHGIAVGLGSEGVRVAQVTDFSRDDQPGITL